MESLSDKDIRAIVENIKNIMEEKKQELIELDSAMGDGDLGISMTVAFNAAARELDSFPETKVNKVMIKVGMAIAKYAPSTLGTLIATGFMRGGKALEDKDRVGIGDLALFFTSFVQGMMERGKAKPGEKTIIDSLNPAAMALDSASKEKKSLEEGVFLAFEAARRGVEETKKMKAEHGRAAYYGEKSQGKQDPGATVGMLIINALSDYIRSMGE